MALVADVRRAVRCADHKDAIAALGNRRQKPQGKDTRRGSSAHGAFREDFLLYEP